jgi:hypothetical protein
VYARNSTTRPRFNYRNAGYRQMRIENVRFSCKAKYFSGKVFRLWLISRLSFPLAFALMGASVSAQVPLKKDVLILNDDGLSHSLSDVVTRQIVSGVQSTAGDDVEFFSESLDLLALPGRPSPSETRDWLAKKYGGHKLEVKEDNWTGHN